MCSKPIEKLYKLWRDKMLVTHEAVEVDSWNLAFTLILAWRIQWLYRHVYDVTNTWSLWYHFGFQGSNVRSHMGCIFENFEKPIQSMRNPVQMLPWCVTNILPRPSLHSFSIGFEHIYQILHKSGVTNQKRNACNLWSRAHFDMRYCF